MARKSNKQKQKEKAIIYTIVAIIALIIAIISPEFRQKIIDNANIQFGEVGESQNIISFDLDSIPEFTDKPYVYINDNKPFFKEEEYTTKAFENYSKLDKLGRCGVAYANVCLDIMPKAGEKRESISSVYPTGWKNVNYKELMGNDYLYNRCHLIGWQLAGENANKQNLITGTRYMNTQGMLPFENLVDDYFEKEENEDNHVLYRVTPIFEGEDLVAKGVEMEAYSVEDKGKGVCFNVYVYNVQPGVEIDYATGKSKLAK